MNPSCMVEGREEEPAPTRRGMLGWLTAGSLFGVLAMPNVSLAGKRHNKKKRKRKDKKPAALPYATCEERCHPSCTRCFVRPEGTPLCAAQGSSNCFFNCSSDSNCVGTGYPYCTTGSYHFATGTFHAHDSCLNGNTSICTDVQPCG